MRRRTQQENSELASRRRRPLSCGSGKANEQRKESHLLKLVSRVEDDGRKEQVEEEGMFEGLKEERRGRKEKVSSERGRRWVKEHDSQSSLESYGLARVSVSDQRPYLRIEKKEKKCQLEL